MWVYCIRCIILYQKYSLHCYSNDLTTFIHYRSGNTMKECEKTQFSLWRVSRISPFELNQRPLIISLRETGGPGPVWGPSGVMVCHIQAAGRQADGFYIKRSSMNLKAVSWKHYIIFTRTYHSWLPLYREACYFIYLFFFEFEFFNFQKFKNSKKKKKQHVYWIVHWFVM